MVSAGQGGGEMPILIIVTIIYVAGGLLLGTLMFMTAMRAEALAKTTGVVMKVTFGNLTLDVSNVLVALAVIAFVAMVGVPSYYLYLYNDDHAIGIQVKFKTQLHNPVRVVREEGGTFQSVVLHVYRSRDKQSFTLTEAPFDPIPVTLWFDKAHQRPMSSVGNGPDAAIPDFDGASGSLGPISFSSSEVAPQQHIAAIASTSENAASVQLHSLADPAAVREQASLQQFRGSTP
jgi:hypothetical protein